MARAAVFFIGTASNRLYFLFFEGRELCCLNRFFFSCMGPSPTRYGQVQDFAFLLVYGNVGFYFFIAGGEFSLVFVGGQRLPLTCMSVLTGNRISSGVLS